MPASRHLLLLLLIALSILSKNVLAQKNVWHGVNRTLHYKPWGNDFVKVQGNHRFNRALYGSNSGFRVEAGDLPEFALYMPGMGGNLRFEIISENQRKWLIDARDIETVYRSGSMIYTIQDTLLGKGKIILTVMALMEGEGILIKEETQNILPGLKLGIVFGGASGKKFNRDGDIGADPESSFDLKPEYCQGNNYIVDENTFALKFNARNDLKELKGMFPGETIWQINQFDTPERPYISGTVSLGNNQTDFFVIANTATNNINEYKALENLFGRNEQQLNAIVSRIVVNTPDSFINTLGGALALAADAIYESPTYLHGAVAWRMRLNAWRGAYVADPLGWHDRAISHFNSYALSQVAGPPSGPVVADTSLGMARQLEQMGTSMFSSGYICRNPNGDIRPHHYDMNLVFVDQLLRHFNWTGDTAYVRKMWPLIKRHLEWEKRNFDADNDGLYDAYACIWASDALQYNGGAVTHSSAYNYRANKAAARLAGILKEDALPYEGEAEKIHNAIRLALWLPRLGSYAEYRDNTASRNLHTAAGLWTIYHALDEGVPDAFEAWQSLQYVNHEIPHIPVQATGLKDTGLYVLSTTNWQPYTWSINNVALAENLHMSLAYWQGGDFERGFTLFKSALTESMFLGTSPGNFQQLSFYDAMRGELYRDFADPVGMASRSLVEGLFGILPDALSDTLKIQPGFPENWDHAALQVPDISIDFKRKGFTDEYIIKPSFEKQMNFVLRLPAVYSSISTITLNGKPVSFQWKENVGNPAVIIRADKKTEYKVVIKWKNETLAKPTYKTTVRNDERIIFKVNNAEIIEVKDPQGMVSGIEVSPHVLEGKIKKENNYGSFFVKLKQGNAVWWQPVDVNVLHLAEPNLFKVNGMISVPVDISARFNDKVTNIFQQKYISPRWSYPTLQLPVQGIGNWCYPKVLPEINDKGLRMLAGSKNNIQLENGIVFQTPSGPEKNNIIFTSLWDNYPDTVVVPISGKGKGIAVMLCGSTNPMQSQMENGQLVVSYTDGSQTIMSLRNPENWWPIEQDYYEDGFAFHLTEQPPIRIHLKTGKIYNGFSPEQMYSSLKGYSNRMIDGGAATVLTYGIDSQKELQSITVKTTASEVVVGLMAVTLLK